MKEYECFINGQKIVISNNFDVVPNDWKVKDILKNKPVEGSLDFDIKLNPLWKRQQETGIPKRVHLSYLCNLN